MLFHCAARRTGSRGNLAPDESVRSSLAAQPRPALLFNLLGTHDAHAAAGLAPACDGRAARADPGILTRRAAYVIEINARIEHGTLIVSIEYSRRAHDAESIARIGAALRDALQGMAHGSPAPVRAARCGRIINGDRR
jgi:hypothetical protein